MNYKGGMSCLKKTLLIVVVMALVICLSAGLASAKSDNGNGQGQGQGLNQQTSETQEFTDIEGHWAKMVIKKAQARGIFEGFGDNTFRPEDPLTKAQAFVLLDKMTTDDEDDGDVDEDDDADDEDAPGWVKNSVRKGVYDVDAAAYGDAPPWARNSVQKAVYSGLIKRFNSDKQCERAYYLVLLAKDLEDENNLPDLPDGYVNPFKDLSIDDDPFNGADYNELDLTSLEIYDYLLRLQVAGIVKGTDGGNLNPNGALKRAEMAVLIDQLDQYKNKNK